MEAPKPTFTTVTGDAEKYNEFYNFGEYYIKLSYTSLEELCIICYNMVILDGIKYELKISHQKIYDLSNIFRQYTNIKDLYDFIIDLISENKYQMHINNDKNLVLQFTISDIKKNEHKIAFTLIHDNNNNTQEYINILSNEIKNMRKINNKNIKEISDLKNENEEIRNEIKNIKDILSKYENDKDNKNNPILKCSKNQNINLKGYNKKILQKNNKDMGIVERICSICKGNTDLRRCICNTFFCHNCILNNKNNVCKEDCFLFNNNLNKLNSIYNISKYPLPKNFEAKVHFTDVSMVRVGITFDSNIINDKKDNNSPNYKIYYILQDLNDFYSYDNKKWNKVFQGKNQLKNGDDLTIILKGGELRYLHNGEDLGHSYKININDLNENDIYLLVHRRNPYSQCELKYIYDIINLSLYN